MTILDSIILGIIQGITEFLPISSSGHLILFEDWLSLPFNDLKSFDVAVHTGTLFAILVYFKNDLLLLWRSFIKSCRGKTSEEKLFGVNYRQFILVLIIGTIPAVFVGLKFENQIDAFFRNGHNVAYAFLYSGFFFLIAEYLFKKKDTAKITYWKSFVIGVFQAIAIVPGISRSGSTIGSGLMVGLNRNDSARFSFLLGIPAILGATILTSYKLLTGSENSVLLSWPIYLIGIAVSFISGYLSIYLLMKFLKSHSLAWFSVYLLPLGIWLILR